MKDQKSLLAKCCRMLEASGLIDFSGHVSARISDKSFFINSHGKSRIEVTPEDLVETDLDGSPRKQGAAVPSEVFIHSSIYRARRDVNAIAHLHSPAVISLSTARRPIFPAIFQGTLFADGIPIYEDARHVNTPLRGNRLAEALGKARVVVMRSHGSAVVADSIKRLFFACIYFEKNAQRLLEAYNAGNPEPLSSEEIQEGKVALMRERIMDKVWDYYASRLDNAGYRK